MRGVTASLIYLQKHISCIDLHQLVALAEGLSNMADTNFMINLPSSVKSLINAGIYTLYRLKEPRELLLVTDDRKIYLLNHEGDVVKTLSSTAGQSLVGTVKFHDLPSDHQVHKLNYA